MPLELPPSSEFHDLAIQRERFLELTKKLPEKIRTTVHSAYALADKAHEAQMRDDGTRYIIHPVRATISLMSECGVTDPNILCASLLHDVVEDTPVTIAQIDQTFGSETARLVKNVTRPRPVIEDEEHIRKDKAEKFKKLFDMDKSTRMVKCADVLDNVRSWPNIPLQCASQKKMPRWCDEVRTYALPIAKKTHPVLFEELQRAHEYAEQHDGLCVSARVSL